MTYSDIVDATCIFDVTSLQQKFNSKILTLPTKHYLQNTAKNKYKLKWTMTKKKTDKGECYVDDMPSVLKYYQLIYYPLFDKFFFNGFCFTQKNTPRKKWYNR